MAELEEKAKLQAQIAEAEKAVKIAEDALEKAKTAGIDVSDLEEELKISKEAVEKLKAAYA